MELANVTAGSTTRTQPLYLRVRREIALSYIQTGQSCEEPNLIGKQCHFMSSFKNCCQSELLLKMISSGFMNSLNGELVYPANEDVLNLSASQRMHSFHRPEKVYKGKACSPDLETSSLFLVCSKESRNPWHRFPHFFKRRFDLLSLPPLVHKLWLPPSKIQVATIHCTPRQTVLEMLDQLPYESFKTTTLSVD